MASSAFLKQTVNIGPMSVATIDFIDNYPNHFRVQNSGKNAVFCSPNNIPTQSQYDFSVSGGGLTMYAEPYTSRRLHIFNPTGNDVDCTVVTFYAEFNPLILALSNIEVEMPNTIETSNIIGGFSASLPAGNEKIGKVDISNLPTDYAKASNQKDYTTLLTNIFNSLAGDNGEYSGKLDEIITALRNISGVGGGGGGSVSPVVTTAFGSGTNNVTLTAPDGMKISEVVFFSNDSESDMTFTHTDYNGVPTIVTIKAGEVLNNVATWANSITINSNGGSYRYGWTVRAV